MNRTVDITAYDAVILDFDGPMCNVFAGYPAATIAQELKQLLVVSGWDPDALQIPSDPHQLVRLVDHQRPALASQVEAALTAAEIAAVATATETPGLTELLIKLSASRTPVAVASNNSAQAIRKWLDQRTYSVAYVAGRDPIDLSRMKPSPFLVIESLRYLKAEAGRAVLIGDSVSDFHAAREAGCEFIAFANKPHKRALFANRGQVLTIKDLRSLTAGCRT